MGMDCESWLNQQHSAKPSSNMNSLSSPLDLGQQNTTPDYTNNACPNPVYANGVRPMFSFPQPPPHLKAGQAIEPRGWFYCLSRFRHAFAPGSNPTIKEDINTTLHENHSPQKRFLVFDQSGDQTTLIFSSAVGTPIPCSNLWNPKPCRVEVPGNKGFVLDSSPIFSHDTIENENKCNHEGSEMHEDTEELDALLYSDDESSYSDDDDEEVSTGHSPSTMTVHEKPESFEGSTGEVANFNGASKKRKFYDRGYSVPSLMDTASSRKPNEGDAESSCGNKRLRKEKIHETISILQDLIPGGKGMDAVVLLDEAIHYLRSLRTKAAALGVEEDDTF